MTDPQWQESLADGYVKWLRQQVGSQLIYLVYATTVVFDSTGRVLAQRRYDFDWWSNPGGAMEIGEALRETARREVREETGLNVDIQGLVGLYTHPQYTLHYPNGDRVQQWTACFWAEVAGGQMQADGGETLDLHWVQPDELIANTHLSHAHMTRDAARVRAGDPVPLEPVETPAPRRSHYGLLRPVVGHAPLILPGALAVIEDAQGRILMTHRVPEDCWDYPSGFADLGETSTANIAREVREETGLVVEPYALIGLYSEPRWYHNTLPNGDIVHGVGPAYACRVVGGELVAEGADDENSAVAFLTDDAINEAGCNAATRQILADYRNRNGWPFVR